jgi:hypothetical protein
MTEKQFNVALHLLRGEEWIFHDGSDGVDQSITDLEVLDPALYVPPK